MKQVVTFRLDRQLFGISIFLVREINQILEITSIPKTPDFVKGLINLRGQIVTILDLGARLGCSSHEPKENRYNIILKTNQELVRIQDRCPEEKLVGRDDVIGLWVDDLGDSVEIDESTIEPTPANVNEMEGRFFSGVVKLKSELLVLLNMFEILKNDGSHSS